MLESWEREMLESLEHEILESLERETLESLEREKLEAGSLTSPGRASGVLLGHLFKEITYLENPSKGMITLRNLDAGARSAPGEKSWIPIEKS